jgi:tetratricopeptide (TPR) repeat protein
MPARGIRIALIVVAGLAAIGGALALRHAPTYESTAVVSVTRPTIPFRSFMTQVIEASKIVDPLERCLKMPDPPGSHWHREGVAAYCRYRYQPAMTSLEFRQRIAEGRGDEVDRILAEDARAQAQDPAAASRLDGAFYRMGLMESSPDMRRAVDAWKRQRPQSAFALAASGFQYSSAAWKARGQDAADDTPDENWTAMRKQAALARAELDRAATLQPPIPLVFAEMFSLAMRTGDEDDAKAAMARGLAVAPDDMALRLIQSAMSGSAWGGSSPLLLKQTAEAAARAPSQPLLWVVVGRARMKARTDTSLPAPAAKQMLAMADEVTTAVDLAWLAHRAYLRKDFTESLILAVEAWRFDDGEPTALWVIGMASQQARYNEWARIILKDAAQKHSDSMSVASNVGVALLALNEPVEAERLLSSAVDRDPTDTWTLSQLGWLYLNATHRYDKAKIVADTLIQREGDDADGYALRAFAQIETDDPDRYRSIHVFLDRFEQRDGALNTADSLRTYLAEHPEPLPGEGATGHR